MDFPQFDLFNLLTTPVWIVSPSSEDILFANAAALKLASQPDLNIFRNGAFSVLAQPRLDAYLPDLTHELEIIEVWTVRHGETEQPMSCRLSLASPGNTDPFIVVEGVAAASGHAQPATEDTHDCEHAAACTGFNFYQQIFRSSSAPMLLIDPARDGRIVDANHAAIRFYGYSFDEMASKHTWEINTMGKDVLPVMRQVAQLPGGHKPLSFEHRLADGSVRHVQTYASPINLDNKRLMLGIIHDVTEQKRLEKELQQAATQDTLTGLWNRRQFQKIARTAHAQAQRYQHPLSLMLLDVDHFKQINDQYGHHQGDEVLIQLARTLKARIRESDAVCRWGGEEFVILLPQTPLAGALHIAKSIRHTVAELKLEGLPALTISIGVAQHQSGDSTETLLKRADEALYRAKALGRNRTEHA